jgi:predicted RND superfamily exporter protein
MKDDERQAVERLLGSDELEPFGVQDLPPGLKTGLMERSGRIDRAVLVFPRPSRALWDGNTIERFVEALRGVAAQSGGRPGRVAGSLPVSRDILAGIRHDGPIASVVAFLGVVATVLVVFRFTYVSALVIASLCTGVLWLFGALVTLGVRINFANFIAFPITFGIGVDYAVNVMTRYVLDGARDIARAIRSTGGAVVLASCTTIIGYSSLLLAQNRALFLFGVVAVLGEIACLTSAVLALPAFVELWNLRHAPHPVHETERS